ncbi:TIGR02453 family protein [Saccharicrinis carchari]|uniref:TIGR02453 family protein n=1 Tax=Saccharicrinis carchari TaxID=1168039 RepID=A0A521CLZ0_SACCC|nr:DUF2461 domain-containing protein [Saccharicrinis carchari]SMO60462.1 TIGR02453 family protein [Saccharicrinis carchari]
MIPKEIFDFLVELSVNNNRDWFNNNKPKYQSAKEAFEQYIDQLIATLHGIDRSIGHPDAKDCTFRIFRDVRFAKNKQPYKNNFGAYIAHGGRKSPYAGYYFHMEPDNSFVGGGLYNPEPQILRSVREHIIKNADEYRQIIDNKKFKSIFNEIHGEKLKTAPKGFDKNDANIELIRYKSYAAITPLSDEQIRAKNIDKKIIDIFTVLKPLNDFINRGVKKALV